MKKIYLAFGLTLLAAPALAQAKFVEAHGSWNVFADAPKNAALCYAGGVPEKQEGKYSSRGDVFVLITHRPKDKESFVFNVEAGYAYKPDSEVTVSVGGKTFPLFVRGGQAWAKDAKTDRALADALRTGKAMTVKGYSSKGTETLDTYNLAGIGAALDAIGKLCNVK